jgi:hypothetical protein
MMILKEQSTVCLTAVNPSSRWRRWMDEDGRRTTELGSYGSTDPLHSYIDFHWRFDEIIGIIGDALGTTVVNGHEFGVGVVSMPVVWGFVGCHHCSQMSRLGLPYFCKRDFKASGHAAIWSDS